MKRPLFIAGLAVAAVALAWCGDDSRSPLPPTTPTPPPPPSIISLRVTGTTQLMELNQTSQLTATASFSDGTSRDVTAEAAWRTFNTAVATVSATGLLAAVTPGRTSVSAAYQGRSSALEVLFLPSGTYILTGTVVEPGNIPVGGARVEVIGGPHAGRSATTPSFGGRYEIFGLSGDLSLRATKDGYIVDTRSVSMTGNRMVDFELRPTTPAAPIAGNYRLTFTASNSCAPGGLAQDARTRSYDALMNQDFAKLLVNLSGAQFATQPRSGTGSYFFGLIRANSVSFTINEEYYYYYYHDLVEQLGSTTYLTISGAASGTATPSTISGSLNGRFSVWEAPNGFYNFGRRSVAFCQASDHQFTFTRR